MAVMLQFLFNSEIYKIMITQRYLLTEITNHIKLPVGAEIVSVDYRAKCICIWARFKKSAKAQTRRVFVVRFDNQKLLSDVYLGIIKRPSGEYRVYEQKV